MWPPAHGRRPTDPWHLGLAGEAGGRACIRRITLLTRARKLTQLERLHDVIVSADLEAGHAVRQVGGAGDHDDADVVSARAGSERA
jgi:hypothetical protein